MLGRAGLQIHFATYMQVSGKVITTPSLTVHGLCTSSGEQRQEQEQGVLPGDLFSDPLPQSLDSSLVRPTICHKQRLTHITKVVPGTCETKKQQKTKPPTWRFKTALPYLTQAGLKLNLNLPSTGKTGYEILYPPFSFIFRKEDSPFTQADQPWHFLQTKKSLKAGELRIPITDLGMWSRHVHVSSLILKFVAWVLGFR